ncbi:MAG: ABC transporter permease [Bacilli bacterium]|nr:ABC transporter permease [Bacilli bacterium]
MVKIDKPFLKPKIKILINNNLEEFKTKDKLQLGIENYLTKDNLVLITKDINKYCQNYHTKLVFKGNINLKESLNHFSKENNITNIEYVDIKKANRLTNNIITTIKIILYGITLLVLLIGISSIINTIWTSINLRSKEFACLKSIGLTKRQMRDMLMIESFYIIIKGFILSLPFICIINYLLYESLNKVFKMEMLIPFKETIIILIVLFLIVYVTMLKTHKIFESNKIITMLTNENI